MASFVPQFPAFQQGMQAIPSPQSSMSGIPANLSSMKNIQKKIADAIKNKKYLSIDTTSRKSNNKAETLLQLGGARNKWKKHPDWIYERSYRLVGSPMQVKYVLMAYLGASEKQATDLISQAYSLQNYDTPGFREAFQKEIDDQSKIKEQGKITITSLSYLSKQLAAGEYFYSQHDRYLQGKYEPVYPPSVTQSGKRSRKTLLDKFNEAVAANLIRKGSNGGADIYNLNKIVDISKSDTGSIVKVSHNSTKYAFNPNRPYVPIGTNSLERYKNALEEIYRSDLQNPAMAAVTRTNIDTLVSEMKEYLAQWMRHNGYISSSSAGQPLSPQHQPAAFMAPVKSELSPSQFPQSTQSFQAPQFPQSTQPFQPQQVPQPFQPQSSPTQQQFQPSFSIPVGGGGLAASPVNGGSPSSFGTTPYQG